MENEKFATEIIRELTNTSKRKDYIIIFLILVILCMFLFYIWHENQYETVTTDETTTIDGGNGTATYLENSNSGDINYGKDS